MKRRFFAVALVLSIVSLIFTFFTGCGKKFTITFYANGGTLVSGSETQKVKSADDIIFPEYEKTGYDFNGWSKEKEEINSDCAVYAKWSPKIFTITFEADKSISPMNIVYDGTIGSLPTVEKEDFYFIGWYFTYNGVEEKLYEGTVWNKLQNITAYAKWIQVDRIYLITLENSDPEQPEIKDYLNYNTGYLKTLPTKTKTGYNFLGWYEKGGDETKTVSLIERGNYGDKTYVAKWAPKEYQVEFREYLDTPQTVSFKYNEIIDSEKIPQPKSTKPGNTFKGWVISYNGNLVSLSSGLAWRWDFKTSETISASINWTNNIYTLTLNANGGTLGTSSVDIAYNTEISGLPTPIKTHEFYGKVPFLGWFIGEEEVKGKWTYTENKTAIAKWELETYNVYYDVIDEPSSFYIGAVPVLKIPKKEGFTFEGWYYDENYVNAVQFDKPLTKSDLTNNGSEYKIDVYAKWTKSIGTYMISYKLEGGKFNNEAPSYYTSSSGVSLISPIRKGYTFVGWKDGENTITKIEAGSTEDKELVAIWSPKTYTISFDYGGFSSKQVVFDNAVNNLPIPEKKGFTFAGWITPEGEQITEGMNWNIDGNKVLTPEWTKGYPITFNLNGGLFLDSIDRSYDGNSNYELPIPVRSGYVFAGWYGNESFSGSPITLISKNESGPKSFYASWTQSVYTVNFVLTWESYVDGVLEIHSVKVDGKTTYASKQVNHGETLGSYLPTGTRVKVDDTSSVYFAGWIYVVDGKQYKVKENTVFSEQTLTGITGCEITLYADIESVWSPNA